MAWSTNVVIFAGAAQLATVSLAATATWLTLVATVAVINLRHVMYSAAPHLDSVTNHVGSAGSARSP